MKRYSGWDAEIVVIFMHWQPREEKMGIKNKKKKLKKKRDFGKKKDAVEEIDRVIKQLPQ